MLFRLIFTLGILMSTVAPAQAASACPPILNHQFERLQDGAPQSLCQYAGKVILVVNTASYCGFTGQYEGLEALYAKYSDKGLVILGFPSNDFGKQEPGDSKAIADFCFNTYGVKFPMLAKTVVSGQGANPFYKDLIAASGAKPMWNFHKYLISADGKRVESFVSLRPPHPSHQSTHRSRRHGATHQPPSSHIHRSRACLQVGSMSGFTAVVKRDVTLAMRRKTEVITAIFFFVVVAALFPLGIGPEMTTLRLVAPGILWVGALLASMLSLGRLFAADYADGTLEQMALAPTGLTVLVAAKVVAHWLLSGLPLVVLAPVLGMQFNLPADALWILTLSLLIGTPVLSLIGAIGAALTLGVRGGDVLIALLVLPLYVPTLIFGAGAVQAEISGLGASAHLSILMAMALIAAVLSPWASAAALRLALES